MPRLLSRPSVVDMRFVTPNIKKGDFYLFKSPVSGRNLYVYPRMMGERCTPLDRQCWQRYATTEQLGQETPSDYQNYLSWIFGTPQRIAAGVQETQESVRRTERLLQLTLLASLAASGLIIWKMVKG
jgi:hypothetical protein